MKRTNMIPTPEDKAAIYIVMSTLLPEDGIASLSLDDTYLLRERVAAIQGEIEYYRIQVENHLADMNAKVGGRSTRKETGDDLSARIARLLAKKGVDLDNLIKSFSDESVS